MIIEQYNIRLRRINRDDIELIRQKRNLPEIRKFMAFKKYITPEMQLKWFESVNNPQNYYFMIETEGNAIGVINCKNVSEEMGYGEGGIFIWEKNLAIDFTPVFASLCLLNAIFVELAVFNKSFIQIMNHNKKAQYYNRSLGYVPVPGQKTKNPYFVLTKEDYLKKTRKINEVAKKMFPDSSTLKISGHPSENNLDHINEYLRNQNNPDCAT